MQQTSYAYLRSRDPRNQIYGNTGAAASPSPFTPRPAYPAADMSIYNRPAAAPAGLAGLAQQAMEDNQAIQNPQSQQQQPVVNPLAGIDIGAPETASTTPDLSNDEGLGSAGLMPTMLPTSAPVMPLDEDDKSFSEDQVKQAQGVMDTVASAVPQTGGVGGATTEAGKERVNADLMKVAQAKDPSKAWQDLQNQPFYQNSSFYTGLMGVGLSIMSGKSPIEAFQIGQGMSQQDSVKKQLEQNRDSLLDQGYSADSVAAAIATGDPAMLRMRQITPQEKMALQAQTNAQENAEWDRREKIRTQNSVDASKRSFDNQVALASARGEIARDNAQFKSEYSVRKTSPKWEKSEELGGITPNFRDKLQQSYRPVINVLSSRNKWMAPTEAAISKLGTGTTTQENAAQQRAAIENLTKLIQGGLASINGDVMNELTGDPDWVNNKLNKISMMAGQGPTEANIKWLKSLGTEIQEIDKEATKYQVAPLVESLILDAKLPPENAIRAANSVFAPGSVRLTAEEFKDWSRGHSKVHNLTFPDDKPAKRSGGALSSTDDWMTKK